jgi:amino acid transporter
MTVADTTIAQERGKPALKRDALGLQNAIVISVAVMSPAASIFFNTIGQAPYAGAAIPFCYLVGFVVALLVANQYSEFSRELPSSGSAYTFVSEGLGAGWGFVTGWIGLIAIALGVPYSFVLMSANLATLVDRWLGIQISWSVYYTLAIGLVFAICYIGIRESLRVDLTLLAFEIGICVILAGLVLFKVGGAGGLTLEPFSPTSAPASGDLSIGIVLAILSFIGFETAAALGEETRNPRRNIPRAIYGSMIVVGAFYVLMAYIATVGYGPSRIATVFAHDAAPFDTIARQFSGGGLALFVDLAGLLSFFSAALAIVNGGARILFTLGRDGLLPPPINWAHPTRGTPAGAVAVLCGLGLVSGLVLGFTMTPFGAFNFLATLDALFVLLIYVLVSVACVRFFLRQRREQLNIARHIIVPVLGTLVAGGISALALIQPGPAPLSYIPFVVGGWLLVGAIVTLVMWRRGQFSAIATPDTQGAEAGAPPTLTGL